MAKMRGRSKSVFVEREVFEDDKRKSRAFSDVEDSDSEDDHDLLTTSDNDWSVEQNKELLKQIDALLPAKDTISFVKTLNKFDWSKIKIGQYAKDDIKSHFTNLISSVRRTRTLGEIIADCDIHNWQKSHADMPKRPLSAYNFFFKEKFNKVKADGDSAAAVVKKLSELYKNLNPKKKQKYIEKANVLQAGYYNAMLEFNSKHPDFEKKVRKAPSANSPAKVPIDLYIKELKANGDYFSLTDARTKWASLPIKKKVVFIRKLLETSDDNKNVSVPKKEKALLDDFEGKPHKPKNAFQLFTDEIRSEVAGKTFSEQAKELGKRWISISADLKSKYTKLAKQEKIEYDVKLKAYIAKMPEEKQKEFLEKAKTDRKKPVTVKTEPKNEKAADLKKKSKKQKPIQNGSADEDDERATTSNKAPTDTASESDVPSESKKSKKKRKPSKDYDFEVPAVPSKNGNIESGDERATTSKKKEKTKEKLNAVANVTSNSDSSSKKTKKPKKMPAPEPEVESSPKKRKKDKPSEQPAEPETEVVVKSPSKKRKDDKRREPSAEIDTEVVVKSPSKKRKEDVNSQDENAEVSPSKKKKKSKKKQAQIERPPKTAFNLFVMDYCDRNYDLAKTEWRKMESVQRKELEKQVKERKKEFMDQLQERLLEARMQGATLDQNNILPCAINYCDPEDDSNDEFEQPDSSEAEESD